MDRSSARGKASALWTPTKNHDEAPGLLSWTNWREHLKALHVRFLGERLSLDAARASDGRAVNDLCIAAGAVLAAANRLGRFASARARWPHGRGLGFRFRRG